MAQKLESGPLQITHGHTDTHVLVQFPRLVPNILLTPEQAEAFIAAVRGSMAKLAEHQKTGRPLAS